MVDPVHIDFNISFHAPHAPGATKSSKSLKRDSVGRKRTTSLVHSFPMELLDCVFFYCNVATLVQCQRVSKRWRARSGHFLYREPIRTSSPTSKPFSNFILLLSDFFRAEMYIETLLDVHQSQEVALDSPLDDKRIGLFSKMAKWIPIFSTTSKRPSLTVKQRWDSLMLAFTVGQMGHHVRILDLRYPIPTINKTY
jgi:hypothetical protein